MITEYLVEIHNSVRADGRRRAFRIALAILLIPSIGALIAPVSTTWSNYIVLGPGHSFVNPADGNGYGFSRPRPSKKPILTSFYSMRSGGTDDSPRLLLEALTTQKRTVRVIGYMFQTANGVVAAAAHGAQVPTLPWTLNYHQHGGVVMTPRQFRNMWKTIVKIEAGPLTTQRLLTAGRHISKNQATDVLAQVLVLTMSFPTTTPARNSTSFLILCAEFIDFEHTQLGRRDIEILIVTSHVDTMTD